MAPMWYLYDDRNGVYTAVYVFCYVAIIEMHHTVHVKYIVSTP